MKHGIVSLASSFVLAFFVGCGPVTHEVSGTVTFEGEPLANGYIAFVPEVQGAGAGATIVDGKYKVNVPPGKSKIEITANKMMKLPPGEVGMYGEKEAERQFIPEKFNVKSELTTDIPPPTATLDFKLTAK